jgi:hypothetical protein
MQLVLASAPGCGGSSHNVASCGETVLWDIVVILWILLQECMEDTAGLYLPQQFSTAKKLT